MAYATTALIVSNYAPELSGVDATVFQQIVDDTAALLDSAVYGSKLQSAHAYLAAHWAALHFDTASASGVVSSVRVKDVQESYATPSVAAEELGSTKFGRRFIEIRKSLKRTKKFTSRSSDWDLPDGRVI